MALGRGPRDRDRQRGGMVLHPRRDRVVTAKIFDAGQAAGMSIFDAPEGRIPTGVPDIVRAVSSP
jgi:hypothetical protein